MPVDKPLLSRVRLEYAGVEYSKDAPQVDAMHADQVVDLTVYETTETDPNLQVQMQHLNVAPGDGGLRVELMLAVQNPVDRAWIGKPGLDGSRATIALPLPIDAKNVQLSGDFHACCARIQPGRVTELQGVLPGVSKFRVGYTMPIKNGAADLAIKTIAPVQNFVMFMPAGLKTANVVGVEPMDASAMGAKDMQFFNAKDLPAGQDVKMSIAGIPQTRAGTGGMAGRAGSAASSSDDTARIALYVAGGGAAMIVMLGGAFIALKTSKARKRAA